MVSKKLILCEHFIFTMLTYTSRLFWSWPKSWRKIYFKIETKAFSNILYFTYISIYSRYLTYKLFQSTEIIYKKKKKMHLFSENAIINIKYLFQNICMYICVKFYLTKLIIRNKYMESKC